MRGLWDLATQSFQQVSFKELLLDYRFFPWIVGKCAKGDVYL